MIDPVPKSLELLADGLRPFVASRVEIALRQDVRSDIAAWDVQQLLVFMWERWNDLFRTELTFVERCLVSELRDYRNRWAHQDVLSERDVHRIVDSVSRLLEAVNSPLLREVEELRLESLDRLWKHDVSPVSEVTLLRRLWPFLLCSASALAISGALLTFLDAPWSWVLSGLVFLATMRIAWTQSERESVQGTGPRECSRCGRIIYSMACPYCMRCAQEPVAGHRERPERTPLASALPAFRVPADEATRPVKPARTVHAPRIGHAQPTRDHNG